MGLALLVVQYEGYIRLRPKSILVAAHAPARAKYGGINNVQMNVRQYMIWLYR